MKKRSLCAFLAAALLMLPGAGAIAPSYEGSLVRLHVLANSDSAEDQSVKLAVKERVYREALRLTEGAGSAEEAKVLLQDGLEDMEKAANLTLAAFESGFHAKVSLEKGQFPYINYGLFAVPAGTYDALRVVIGAGEGHNWWCVVFPPLCAAATKEEVQNAAAEAGLTDTEAAYLIKDSERPVLKLKTVELIRKLLCLIRG